MNGKLCVLSVLACLLAVVFAGEDDKPVKAIMNIQSSAKKGRYVMELDATNSKGPIDRYMWTLQSSSDKGRKIEAPKVTYTTSEKGAYEWKLSVCTVKNRCDVKTKTVRAKDN